MNIKREFDSSNGVYESSSGIKDDMSYLQSWLRQLTARERSVLLQTEKIKNPINFAVLKQYLKNIPRDEDEVSEIIAVDEDEDSDIELVTESCNKESVNITDEK
jgi:hypothetical protein